MFNNCSWSDKREGQPFFVPVNFIRMTKNNEIYNQPNNSKLDVTSTHETGKYSNPKLQAILASGSPYSTLELQAAYDAGRRIGRIEGMISYQRHLIENLQKENVQLNQKLQTQKGGNQ